MSGSIAVSNHKAVRDTKRHPHPYEIERHLVTADSIEDSCRNLIADANAGGGLDNVTVVLIEASRAEG